MRWVVLVAALIAGGAEAAASPEVTALRPPRAISRSASADRDTWAMNLVVLPRDIRTAGAELALVTVGFDGWTLRTGFGGLLELESDGETTGFGNVFPAADGMILWRGAYAYYAALSLDDAAERLCDGCALELTAGYRHESQHYTGSNVGDPGVDVSDQPFVGDCFTADAAIGRRSARTRTSARLLGRGYLPGRSSYSALAAVDLGARWLGFGRWQPFVSGYAEIQRGAELGGRRFPNSHLVRALVGVAVTSSLGDILVYGFGDVGNRRGIRMLTEEATAGLGIRLALP